MKSFLLGSVALASLSVATSASAADLAARPYTKAPPIVAAYYNWSGFYIGANGGYGTQRDCRDRVTPAADVGCHDADGAVAGGQIGYRWQSSAWVFGLEAQGDWADLKGGNVNAFSAGQINANSKLDAFGLFTGQIGYAWNNTLAYVKGGAAITSNKYEFVSLRPADAGFVTGTSSDNNHWSGTVGAGLEYGFTPNWSVALEYDHIFTGARTVISTSTTSTANAPYRDSGDVDLITARINYRWGGPVIAKY
jgi:outer membrane immunogenic protein